MVNVQGIMQERWYCTKCEKHGRVEYSGRNSDVMSVIYLIGDDHLRISPECSGRIKSLQVLNEEDLGNVSQEERNKILQNFGLEADLQP